MIVKVKKVEKKEEKKNERPDFMKDNKGLPLNPAMKGTNTRNYGVLKQH